MRNLPAVRPPQSGRLSGPIFTCGQGLVLFLLCWLLPIMAQSSQAPAESAGRPIVMAVRVTGVINPVVADFLAEELARANSAEAAAS